jgi:hypothetical protein
MLARSYGATEWCAVTIPLQRALKTIDERVILNRGDRSMAVSSENRNTAGL